MEESQLFTLLSTLNIPVAYDHFTSKNISVPFVLYRNNNTDTFKADDKSYFKNREYIIDLCTDKKDIVAETNLETLLDNNHLPFDKEEDFIESENIYQIRYFI